MAKGTLAPKHVAPVYAVAPAQEHESRWQCATCRGYLAFSLPLAVTAMAQLLLSFSRAHARCAPPDPDKAPPPAPHPYRPPAAAPEPAGIRYDPNGPTAKAWARREALLALPRDHTPAEKNELTRLEKKLTLAGVLSLATTF